MNLSLASAVMPVELVPIPLPASADPNKFTEFGRQVQGVDLSQLTPLEFEVIEQAVYKVLIWLPTAFQSSNSVAWSTFISKRQLESGAAVCPHKGSVRVTLITPS